MVETLQNMDDKDLNINCWFMDEETKELRNWLLSRLGNEMVTESGAALLFLTDTQY